VEHWFKNVQEQRYSKHALEYVLAYKELMIDGEFGAGRKLMFLSRVKCVFFADNPFRKAPSL